MVARILSIVFPLVAYVTLVLAIRGVFRERRKLDRLTLFVIAGAFLASTAFRPFEHLLFFDEDIYSNIASNLAHAPVAQLTLFGGVGHPEASTYYKEPPGYPVLLSLLFLFSGTKEIAALIFARLLFALAAAGVYQLAREICETRLQALIAAVVFAASPACFAYSGSAGTDLAAALFATLGVWGITTGNGMLAAAGLAYAAGTRMELLALAPLILASPSISRRWKAAGLGLMAPAATHVAWVFTIAPQLAKVEHIQKAFAMDYVWPNVITNVKFLFNPFVFPVAVGVLGAVAAVRDASRRVALLMWIWILFLVYVCFYAGSFDVNPRYSIQIAIPLIVLAASLSRRKICAAALLLSAVIANVRPFQSPSYVQLLAADHRIATELAAGLDQNTLVLTTEPEEFMNAGAYAMNAVYASETGKLRQEAPRFKRVVYYAGIRTGVEGSVEEAADRWVKSNFQLHLIVSRDLAGRRIAYYELLL